MADISKATARPWRHIPSTLLNGSTDICHHKTGAILLTMRLGSKRKNDANAALIVQAVNSFDVMLAALKAVSGAFANDMTPLEQHVAIRMELAGVCAAIKLAEGTP